MLHACIGELLICPDATISPDLSNDDTVTEGDMVSLCVVIESEGGALESPVDVFLMANPGMLFNHFGFQ